MPQIDPLTLTAADLRYPGRDPAGAGAGACRRAAYRCTFRRCLGL